MAVAYTMNGEDGGADIAVMQLLVVVFSMTSRRELLVHHVLSKGHLWNYVRHI